MTNWLKKKKKRPVVCEIPNRRDSTEGQLGAGAFEREIKFIVSGGEMDSAALRPWKQEVHHRGKRSNKLGPSDVKEEPPNPRPGNLMLVLAMMMNGAGFGDDFVGKKKKKLQLKRAAKLLWWRKATSRCAVYFWCLNAEKYLTASYSCITGTNQQGGGTIRVTKNIQNLKQLAAFLSKKQPCCINIKKHLIYISAPASKQKQRERCRFSNKTECDSLNSEWICMKIWLKYRKIEH